MAVYIDRFIAILPQIIISGLAAFFLNRILSYNKMKLTFKIERRSSHSKLYGFLSGQYNSRPANGMLEKCPMIYGGVDWNLRSISVTLMSFSAWILVLLSFMGIGRSSIFVPVFSWPLSLWIYGSLLILFTISIMASLSTRTKFDIQLRLSGVVIAVVTTILFFYLPSMRWFMDAPRNIVITAATVYFAVLFIVFIAYLFWWYMEPRKSFRISVYTSVATYVIIVALMFFKDFSLFHL